MVLTGREDQENRGMQAPGRDLDPGHLPVQVSLFSGPMSDWTQKLSGGLPPICRRWMANASYVDGPIMTAREKMKHPYLAMNVFLAGL